MVTGPTVPVKGGMEVSRAINDLPKATGEDAYRLGCSTMRHSVTFRDFQWTFNKSLQCTAGCPLTFSRIPSPSRLLLLISFGSPSCFIRC